MNPTTRGEVLPVPAEGIVFAVDSLVGHLAQVTDPRAARGVRYRLVDLLLLLILAKLGGEDTMQGMAEWVKVRGAELIRLLGLSYRRLPHQTT
jgi:hypothetical protein